MNRAAQTSALKSTGPSSVALGGQLGLPLPRRGRVVCCLTSELSRKVASVRFRGILPGLIYQWCFVIIAGLLKALAGLTVRLAHVILEPLDLVRTYSLLSRWSKYELMKRATVSCSRRYVSRFLISASEHYRRSCAWLDVSIRMRL